MPVELIVRTKPGLIENAAGQLKCPHCREPLTDATMCQVVTARTTTLVEPAHTDVHPHGSDVQAQLPMGLSRVAVGLACGRDHYVFVRLQLEGGTIRVTTEWDEERND